MLPIGGESVRLFSVVQEPCVACALFPDRKPLQLLLKVESYVGTPPPEQAGCQALFQLSATVAPLNVDKP